MSSSTFWCHSCHSVVHIPSSSSSLVCASCGFGFVEEISTDPGLLFIPGNPRFRDLLSDGDDSPRDLSASRSSSSGRGFLRRFFRSNRTNRQGSEERTSLLQVLEIASLLQRSRNTESSNEGGDPVLLQRSRNTESGNEEGNNTGSRNSLGLSWMNGSDNELSRILGARGEDGDSSVAGITASEGSRSLVEGARDDMPTSRPVENLLHRFLSNILQGGRSGSLPASKAAIAAMPIFKIGKQCLVSDACGGLDEPLTECAVCKEVFEIGGEVREMPCKHFYHSDCILPWLELHSSCPLCRREMPTDTDERASSSATSEGVIGSAGGEPTVVFIGISGTGIVVFSFVMLGAASRNATPVAATHEGEQGARASHITDGAVEAGSRSDETMVETPATEFPGEADGGGQEVVTENLASNPVVEVESSDRYAFEDGEILSPSIDTFGEGTDQLGSLGERDESSQGPPEHNNGNPYVESGGEKSDIATGISRLRDEPGPSNGSETWSERQLGQFMGDNQAESSSGTRGRSLFSWFFRHAAARYTPPNTAESSAEGNTRTITESHHTTVSHDDAGFMVTIKILNKLQVHPRLYVEKRFLGADRSAVGRTLLSCLGAVLTGLC